MYIHPYQISSRTKDKYIRRIYTYYTENDEAEKRFISTDNDNHNFFLSVITITKMCPTFGVFKNISPTIWNAQIYVNVKPHICFSSLEKGLILGRCNARFRYYSCAATPSPWPVSHRLFHYAQQAPIHIFSHA